MATETPAQMAARFRKMAQDPNLPQAVKNTYLDKANAVEKAAAKPTMAKGGAVMPQRGSRTAKHKEMKMAKGGAVKPMVKGGKPTIALIIGVGKPAAKPMAKKGK
jgi:hypothetical protein